MKQLSGLDAAFLSVETVNWPTHVASITIFDPSKLEGGYTVERLKENLEGRLHLLPPFRWRLVEPPLGLGRPYWIEDPDFDIEYHIRRIGVPSPGGREELGELMAQIYRRRMDRRRPLWEWWIVEGLRDGHVAAMLKIHHAYIDGVSGAGMTQVMFDTQPDSDVKPPAGYKWRPERVPSGGELFWRSLPFFLGTPRRLARNLRSIVDSGRGALEDEELAKAMPTEVPRTSFNDAVTQHRSFAFKSVSLSDVKRVKNRFGTKVNDVVLAICAGSLRRYLEARGELPEHPLIASVPVNIRKDDTPAHGNQISGMLTGLATDVADPVERLQQIYRNTQASKLLHEAMGAESLAKLADTPPPLLLSLAMRFYARTELVRRHRPVFNLVISNVPGPRGSLYHMGAEVKAVYSMGICFDGVGLFIGLMSHKDQIDFGILGCRELVPDPWSLADGIGESLAELVAASRADEVAPSDPIP